jgi:hypothetical protein
MSLTYDPHILAGGQFGDTKFHFRLEKISFTQIYHVAPGTASGLLNLSTRFESTDHLEAPATRSNLRSFVGYFPIGS